MDNQVFTDNVPNSFAMQLAFSPMFGNMSFALDPPGLQGQQIDNNFPIIPDVSIEALLYEQMASNPLRAPLNVLSGSNTGQQVIGGQITQQDQNGTSRFQQGFQSPAG